MYQKPIISVSRQSKRIAVFDDLECVRAFEDYTNEAEAIEAARQWLKDKTTAVPELVFPKITRMTTTYAR